VVSGAVPGVERQPLKKLEPDAMALLRLIERWRSEAMRAGRPINRIALAYEAGRDGFWLACWLIARGIEAHVIHSASVAVSRERKRAKTDREARLVRCIDDFVICFQYRSDAIRVQDALRLRLGKFGLTLEPTKTKLVEFGRFAQRHASKRGRKHPETIYFLGLTL
jgi:transposase